MEYLNSVDDKLNSIDESNIKYVDLLVHPEFFFGNVNFTPNTVDFCKFPVEVQEKMTQYDEFAYKEMQNLNSASCGVRLRFETSSKRVIFKIQLKRKWGYLKMVNWNSMGFDVYALAGDKYIHKTIFAPEDGKNIFAEEIVISGSSKRCIFLPNYNTIEKFYIGIEEGSSLKPCNYPDGNRLPIIFYGNSVTQGAAASRSGNAFPNVVSKKLNRDIINISCSSCCRGDEEMAELIGKINCKAIVIDYTRNAYYFGIFERTHEKFYNIVRKYYTDKKIILMTSACFNHWSDYPEFDEVVLKTYQNAVNRGENVSLINQTELFDKSEYSQMAIDFSHYTDYGMFKIADEICKLID